MLQYSNSQSIFNGDKNILTVSTGRFKKIICSRARYRLSCNRSFERHMQLNVHLGTQDHQPFVKEVLI